MKTEINIEQFDNGVTLEWKSLDVLADIKKKVFYECDIYRELGKVIYDDVIDVMDSQTANKVKMLITIEGIEI